MRSKFLTMILILFWGCQNSSNSCDLYLFEDSLVYDIRLYNPLKVLYNLNLKFDKIDTLKTWYEPYTIAKEYKKGECILRVYALQERPRKDSFLVKGLKFQIEEESKIELTKPLKSIKNDHIFGLWANVESDSIQYFLFEGGNYQNELTVRVLLTQKKEKMSVDCFEKTLKSIRFEQLAAPDRR